MTFLHRRCLPLFILILVAACSHEPLNKSTQTDLANIKALLPGDYIGKTNKGNMYHTIAQLQVPNFGGDILYHHISTESLRGPAIQQKIYVFDDTGKQMLATAVLTRGEVFIDNPSMARKLNALTEEKLLRFPDGCQFQWEQASGEFVGEVGPNKCTYNSPSFGGAVSPEMKYQLSRCGLTISEGIYRDDGSSVFPPSVRDFQRVKPLIEGC